MILSGSIKYIGTILEGYQTQNFDSGRIYYFTNETPGQYAIYDVEGGRLIETIGLRTFNKCFEGLNLPKKPKPTPQPKQTINTTILPIGEITLTVNDLFNSDGDTLLDVTLDVFDMTFDGSLYYDDNGEFTGHDLTLSSITHDSNYLPGARLDYVLEGLEHEFNTFFDDVPNMLNSGHINEGLNLPKKANVSPRKAMFEFAKDIIDRILIHFYGYPFQNEWLAYDEHHLRVALNDITSPYFFYIEFHNIFGYRRFSIEYVTINHLDEEELVAYAEFPIEQLTDLNNIKSYPLTDMINYIRKKYINNPIHEGLNLQKKKNPTYERIGEFVTWEIGDNGNLYVAKLDPERKLDIQELMDDLFWNDMYLETFGSGHYYITHENSDSVFFVDDYGWSNLDDLNTKGSAVFEKSSMPFKEYVSEYGEELNEGLNLPKRQTPEENTTIGELFNYLTKVTFAKYVDEIRYRQGAIVITKGNKTVYIQFSDNKFWVEFDDGMSEPATHQVKQIKIDEDTLYKQTIEDLVDNYVFDPDDLREGLNLIKKRIPQVGDAVRFYRSGDDEFMLGTIKYVRDNEIYIQLPTNTHYSYKRRIKDQNSEYPLRAWWFDGEQPNDIIYEGLNIPKKMEPIELTTELLPIIDVCMYGTVLDPNEFIFETQMMSNEGAEKYWEYFDMNIYINYILTQATNFIEQEITPHLKEMSIGVVGIDVHEIDSPKYYNYGCDRLFYDLLVSSSFDWLILNDINNQDQEELNRFLYESYRSYPGFSSHMPQSVNSLKAAITDNDERERGVAAYLAFKLKDELAMWPEAFYDYAREDHSDLDFLREDTPGDIIDKMLEELNGNEVDWTEDDDAEDGELIQEGLNLPKKLPFTISDVIIKLGQKFSLHHVDYSMDDDDDSDPYQVSFSIFLNINNNDRVVHFETFNLRQGIRVPIRDNKTKWNVHSTEFSQNIFTDDFNELLYKVSEFIQSELDRLNNTEDEMLQEGLNLPKKKSIDLNTLRPTLIKWLMNEYTEESAEDQIDNAKIKIDGDIVTIVYDNGVKDVVRIIPRINNDPEVEQLSEGLNLPKRLDAKKYKVTVDYEEGEDYLTPTELFDLANSITVELEDDTLEEIVTIDDAIDRLFLAGYNVTLMDELNEGLNLPKKQSLQSWFQSILNQTTGPHTTPNYPNSLFYKLDDDVIFEYNRKNGYFWVEYYSMWSVFEGKFNLNYSEIQALIKPMVEEHYKLESVTPDYFSDYSLLRWKNITNWNQDVVNEGLNLPKKKIQAAHMTPTDVVVYPSGNIIELPSSVVMTLKYDNIITWDDEWTAEKPDGQWGINEDDEWILEYYISYHKLPPKDRYESYINIGDSVIVEDPSDEDDMWNNEFVGQIVGFRNDDLIMVEDGDGDVFDVENYKLHLDS